MKYTAHFNGGQDTLEVASAAQRGPDTEGGYLPEPILQN